MEESREIVWIIWSKKARMETTSLIDIDKLIINPAECSLQIYWDVDMFDL